MKGMDHNTRMHEVVEEPTSQSVKRGMEILERVRADPKSAAVVAEEVVDKGNIFGGRLPTITGSILGVDIEPRV